MPDRLLTCSGCGVARSPDDFNRDARTSTGRKQRCRDCTQGSDRQYRYGLDDATYRALVAAQCGACAICGDPFTDENYPCVDHDHSCCPGRVGCGACNRGLLCSRCNLVIGSIEDDTDILERSIQYLNREVPLEDEQA